jgi:hypothetical protein
MVFSHPYSLGLFREIWIVILFSAVDGTELVGSKGHGSLFQLVRRLVMSINSQYCSTYIEKPHCRLASRLGQKGRRGEPSVGKEIPLIGIIRCNQLDEGSAFNLSLGTSIRDGECVKKLMILSMLADRVHVPGTMPRWTQMHTVHNLIHDTRVQ